MIKILFLAYYFPPVGGSGVQRALKFVQYLPGEGFLPIVVAGPTAPQDHWAPQDASLSSLIPREVEVHRVSNPAPDVESGLRRRMGRLLQLNTSFSDWWIHSSVELGAKVGSSARLIFSTMSPFESGEAARQLAKRLNIPWVADLRDPWALDDIQIYPSAVHRRIEMSRMEDVLSSASLIIMNTSAAKTALLASFPSLASKSVISITNGFDREDFTGQVRQREDSKFRIVHSGGLFTDAGLQLRRRRIYRMLGGVEKGVDILTRSPDVLLRALDKWCEERPQVRKDVEVVFAGKATTEDKDIVKSSSVSGLITFIGYLSHSDSLALIRTADLLFLPMHNLPLGKSCRSVPGKTFEYMASGRPILAAVPDGDARDFMTKCGTGLVCRPDDVSGMANILDSVYSSWKNGSTAVSPKADYLEQFERRNLTHALASALDRVAGTEKPFAEQPVLTHF